MQMLLEKIWYGSPLLSFFLWPFSYLYLLITRIRRYFLINYRQQKFSIPIIIVGNLTVGGVGKTPLVAALAKEFLHKGIRVGIVSRGYGRNNKNKNSYEVGIADKAEEVGDEPLLLAQQLHCPVVVDKNRARAVKYLLHHYRTQVIISDDGLQHYAMGRSIEIAVIDGSRGLGNGFCLPAGPLREKRSRLDEVDFLVVNNGHWPHAFQMKIKPNSIVQINSGKEFKTEELKTPLLAVAAIGNPQRFLTTLKEVGLNCPLHAYADHYSFQPEDFQFKEASIIMTEKDAVKCKPFAKDNWFYLPVEASLSPNFWQSLWSHQQLKGLQQ